MVDEELLGQVDAYIDEVWEDVVSDIRALVSHPSVADASAACDGAPFGVATRRTPSIARWGIAERLGYQVSDDAGYVGMADIPGRARRADRDHRPC